MKTRMKVLICSLVLVFTYSIGNAQSSEKQLKKELKAKVEKDCRKTAKQLKKEGWKIIPGKLPLEKQIQESRYAELNKDKNGEKLYFTGTHSALGGNYSAAKKIADDRARTEIAANINMKISELIKNKVGNQDYGDKDIEAIDHFISANKNLVSATLQGVFPTLEIYRETDNKVQVQVMVKTNAANALKLAKKALRDKLCQQSADLAKELDQLLPY